MLSFRLILIFSIENSSGMFWYALLDSAIRMIYSCEIVSGYFIHTKKVLGSVNTKDNCIKNSNP